MRLRILTQQANITSIDRRCNLSKPQVLQESRSWLSDLGIATPEILRGGNTCQEG